jgi:asparagine synthase (glutamine-hydrolysing)
MFAALLGPRSLLDGWKGRALAHADWLGQGAFSETLALQDGSLLMVVSTGPNEPGEHRARQGAWGQTSQTEPLDRAVTALGPSPPSSERDLERLWASPTSDLVSDGAMAVLASPADSEVRFIVPYLSTRQLVYVRHSRGYIVTDDARLLIRSLGLRLDPHGIYALLQHGAIPAPFTLHRDVIRVPSGTILRLRGSNRPPLLERLTLRASAPVETSANTASLVRTLVQDRLRVLPQNSVLYFSGGIDSGLLAALLARMDRRDVKLLNYSFGKADREAAIAQEMARRIGLSFHQVEFRPEYVDAAFQRVGHEYSFPFADASVIPTNHLVHASLELIGTSGAIVDGTGADGAFGKWPRYREWRRLYRIPRPLRALGAKAYAAADLWHRPTRREYYGRIMRRSVCLPAPCAAITAINALGDIAYAFPYSVRAAVDRAVLAVASVGDENLDAEKQFSMLDLELVCAGRVAPKSFDPLELRGVEAHYPFLAESVLATIMRVPWDEDYKRGEAKGVLKSMLAESVPAEFVYRPKSGFIPPLSKVIASPAVRHELACRALSETSPLRPFLREEPIRTMLQRATGGGSASVGVYYLLFAIAFTSAWLAQVQCPGTASRVPPHIAP